MKVQGDNVAFHSTLLIKFILSCLNEVSQHTLFVLKPKCILF